MLSSVAGRCVPTFIKDVVDEAGEIADSGGQHIVDRLNNTVNGTAVEEGTK